MTAIVGRLGMLLGVLVLGVALTGCEDGVEIKSPLLNTVATSLGAGPKKDPQLADRPGIVIPPTTAALPQPGSDRAVIAAVDAQMPLGPEQAAAAAAAAKKRQEEEACKAASSGSNRPKSIDPNTPQCPGLLMKLWQTGTSTQANSGQ